MSSSIDSATSESTDSTDSTQTEVTTSHPRKIKRPQIQDDDSALSRSRGKEKHITRLGLEKMVQIIKEKTDPEEPLSPSIEASLPVMSDITPRPSSPFPKLETEKLDTSPTESQLLNSSDSCYSTATAESSESKRSSESNKASDHRGSDTSVSSGSLVRTSSIVHGFSPAQLSSSFRTKSKLSQEPAMPPRSEQASKLDAPKKSGMFTLGGSSGDDESSFEDRPRQPKKSSLSSVMNSKQASKKTPSFRDIVESRRIEEGSAEDEDAVASDSEDDEVSDDEHDTSESAIDDDEWEDSNSDAGKSPPVEKTMFQRVESQANLTSRRSMLTMALHEPQRGSALANTNFKSSPALRRSRTSSPNGPSVPGSPEDNEGILTMQSGTAARPMPIISTTTNTHPLAHSPRTTRRNMLATELPESLRKHLLWERKQKNTTANAFLKRHHTSQNMTTLSEYPRAGGQQAQEVSKNNSWTNAFDAPWEYNARGW